MKTLYLIILLAVSTLAAHADTPDTAGKTTQEADVMARFTALTDAVRDNDWDGYFALFDHDHFSGMNADGSLWADFDAFKAVAEHGYQAIKATKSLIFDPVNITIIDANTAILTNQYTHILVLQDGQTITSKGAGVQIWSKASGTWLLVSVSAAPLS